MVLRDNIDTCALIIIKKENIKGTIKNGQYRETYNIDEDKQNKNTKQYILDTNIRKL